VARIEGAEARHRQAHGAGIDAPDGMFLAEACGEADEHAASHFSTTSSAAKCSSPPS
jgi:hypothetical protein